MYDSLTTTAPATSVACVTDSGFPVGVVVTSSTAVSVTELPADVTLLLKASRASIETLNAAPAIALSAAITA